MIKRLSIYAGIAMVIFTISGCSNKDGDGVKQGVHATIDDKNWSAFTQVTLLQDDKFVITATSLTGEVLVISVFGKEQGTYTLGTGSAGCAAVFKASPTASTEDSYVSISGSVIVTEVNTANTELSGTFDFTLIRSLTKTKEISNGTFHRIKYNVVTIE